MKIDSIIAAEDDRQKEQQLLNKIGELLTEIQALWKGANNTYNKYLNILLREFSGIFSEKKFQCRNDKNGLTMFYGEKTISFEFYEEKEFGIIDKLKSPSCLYSFSIEPKNLDLKYDSTAYLSTTTYLTDKKVEFFNNATPDYEKEIRILTDYIEQLKAALSKVDTWEFDIIPDEKALYLLKREKFNNITEIIDAIP